MILATLLLSFQLLGRAEAFVQRSWDESYALANAKIAQMTVDEKVGILTGVGQFNSRCVGDTHPVDRLGIPSICFQDGPAGLRLVKGVTGFPSGINTASTFSRRLMRARGVALGEESRGKGVNVFLGPAMDIMRNPKAGRGWESFGPDPFLTGEGSYETIIGVQSTGVQACAKHFVANNQEHWRYGVTSNLDERTMWEVYGWPFLRSIDADVTSVMCAYNRVNGTSSCGNSDLLGPKGFLRENGFKGFVVSDWGATHDAAKDVANAGLEMEQPGDWIVIGGGDFNNLITGLKPAVKSGAVTTDRLNEMVGRVLAAFYHLGQDSGFPAVNFDAQHSDGSGSKNLHVSVRSDAHTALVREIASASAVLLKNNRTTFLPAAGAKETIRGLPITKSRIRTMAIIGQDAKMPNLSCNDLNECNDGTMSVGWGSGSNSLEFVVPPVDALMSENAGAATLATSLSNDLNAGANAARDKDVAFVFANAMSGELGFYSVVVGNMGDRNDLDLWFKGGSLIERVAAVCNNTIVVIHSVGPVVMPWSSHPNITAIVYAGAPGEMTGPSLVDVLYGRYNPRGRLPFSIADKEADFGTSIVYNSLSGFPEINYTEKLLLDYRYMDANGITPRFEFGFGLSYTTFAYSGPLSIASGASGTRAITFTVTNSGEVPGTEIAQLYLAFPAGAGEPQRVLRGFEEVPLGVGESRSVTIALGQRDMSIWDVVRHAWVVPPGTFTVTVGASINDVRLTGTF
ncbi:hypothetical protein PC9H_008300 [Pleurotus ostreatus]|uniref:beta-glucosidase n=1 Tax=Pleurotus ostreatus TaxID=5322 RepID=A0A8H6ZNM7_PLEOS|nr:uncharacterized protein PC9H_008300 [Pleurotus ostreatus]KAF7425938.1 hypothetical protein PC9H_008300 [Pleurotus ostreatus]KAJ8693335.1 hypothetical protein PTI98_008339 [Pleurotus ostreatus]